jgi:cyclopropane-fatty-acyl-phospholipid synthase
MSESPGLFNRLARLGVLKQLSALEEGEVRLVDHKGERTFGTAGPNFPVSAALIVKDPAFYTDVALGGALGAAESFMAGRWESDDLTALLRIFARTEDVGSSLDRGAARLKEPLRRLLHRMNRNRPTRSRENIAAHYDLGNDFFQLFLDDNWMYSSALYASPDESLEQASRRKLDAICSKLRLGPEDEVLEIGTGWGGFALHAASRYGCRVVSTTISRRQHEKAAERVREAGLQDRIKLLLEDYRDLPTALDRHFTKLVSIEMIEAVGHEFLDTFFSTCSRLLTPDGLMLLQCITIQDQRYERYRRSVDFIQRYIFPGGHLPSLSALTRSMTRASDLGVRHLEDLTPSYALTLREWRRRFRGAAPKVLKMGFDQAFLRRWDYYFCYCEAGFLERTVGDLQLLLARPLNRTEPVPSALGGAS